VRRAAPAALACALAALACNPDDVVHRVGWFATMRHQRSVKPYAEPRMPVPGTVPVTGDEVDSVAMEAADRLPNPRARTAESLNRGQWVYDTYCLVCHGPAGLGDGPISAANGRELPGPFPGIPSLVDADRQQLTDGWLYAVVTNAQVMGRGLMPRYGDKVRGTDRWDVVNYVRGLQTRARAGGSAATAP
jgi:mono/diheme cytochrome c family protein